MCKNNTTNKDTFMREATFEEAVILKLDSIQESLAVIYKMLEEMRG